MNQDGMFSQRSSESMSVYRLKSNDVLTFHHVGDYINVFGKTIYKLVCDKEWSSLTLSYVERSDCVYIELKGCENRHE